MSEVPPSDGAPLVFPPTRKDVEVVTSVVKVPYWLYDREEDVCGLTKASFIWWSNLVCAIFHFFLAITSVVVATAGGKGMDTPKLTVYLTNLTWQANSTDALIPVNEPQDGLYLAHMTMWFFLLSAMAHGLICAGNFNQAFALNDTSKRVVTQYTGWYYVWVHECRQPLRWIEYSFSASLMIITIAVASGVAHVYMIAMIFALMWCTMTYGYFTEVLSRPEDNSNDKPTQWVIRDGNFGVLFVKTPGAAVIQRLFPHLMGYVPYTVIWVVLLHSFFYNVGDGGGPPGFVYVIVIGQLVVFTGFGVTQFLNQFLENGPSWYFWGEMSYLALSLFSKGFLGLTLIANVLLYDSFEEASANAS